jgi:hypothetical protein
MGDNPVVAQWTELKALVDSLEIDVVKNDPPPGLWTAPSSLSCDPQLGRAPR